MFTHAVIKGLYLLFTLIRTMLVEIPPFQCVIIQNPPCLPLLLAVWLVNVIRHYWCMCYYVYYMCHLYFNIILSIIGKEPDSNLDNQMLPPELKYEELHISVCLDWHNLGYTMYPQYSKHVPNNSNVLISLSKAMEYICSKWIVDEHICVSNCMKEYLIRAFEVPEKHIRVLYDRPFRHFANASKQISQSDIRRRHDILIKQSLTKQYLFNEIVDDSVVCSNTTKSTIKTKCTLQTMEEVCTSTHLEPRRVEGKSIVEPSYTESTNTKLTLLTLPVSTTDSTCSKSSNQKRLSRDILIMSSTSWSEDEDFDILIDAVTELDGILKQMEHVWPCNINSNSDTENNDRASKSDENMKDQQQRNWNIRKMVVAVTGKGPLKAMYEKRFEILNAKVLKYIRFKTLWLEAVDYPLFVGYADLGICLHTSTSGMDLPMKVLDMYGSCVPVCAVKYECIDELVQHNKNGLLFQNSTELCRQLYCLFYKNEHGDCVESCADENTSQKIPEYVSIEDMKQELINNYLDWETNWNEVMRPVVSAILNPTVLNEDEAENVQQELIDNLTSQHQDQATSTVEKKLQ